MWSLFANPVTCPLGWDMHVLYVPSPRLPVSLAPGQDYVDTLTSTLPLLVWEGALHSDPEAGKKEHEHVHHGTVRDTGAGTQEKNVHMLQCTTHVCTDFTCRHTSALTSSEVC